MFSAVSAPLHSEETHDRHPSDQGPLYRAANLGHKNSNYGHGSQILYSIDIA